VDDFTFDKSFAIDIFMTRVCPLGRIGTKEDATATTRAKSKARMSLFTQTKFRVCLELKSDLILIFSTDNLPPERLKCLDSSVKYHGQYLHV